MSLRTELADVQLELATLREHFERRVTARVQLVLQAARIAPNVMFDAASTDDAIRAKAVSAALGPAAIDGKSATYIEARFDSLAEQHPPDPVVLALASRPARSH